MTTTLSVAVRPPGMAGVGLDAETYVLFREFVRERTGIVYGPSRRGIFESRVLGRVATLGLSDARAYYRYLRFHPRRNEEFLELASVLTNNETYFFREEKALIQTVHKLGEFLSRGRARVLSAGASSGEELASLAMLAKEMGLALDAIDFQGIDIDVRMVAAASNGLYRERSFRNTAAERIVRYFVPEGDGRRIKPSLHRHLHFRWANLVDGTSLKFPHPFNVVLCRNVLIYFDAPTVERVARLLHGLLADDGILVVGVSESLAHIPFLYEPERVGDVVLYRKVPL